MRQRQWLNSRFFSIRGIPDVFFPRIARFEDFVATLDENFELRKDTEGSWTVVEGHEEIPALVGAEVTGRPASSTEYKNSADMPTTVVEVDYQYVMLKGYWPDLKKRWRLVIDSDVYTGSPMPDGSDADVWGIESDSQRTFTRLRVYKQAY